MLRQTRRSFLAHGAAGAMVALLAACSSPSAAPAITPTEAKSTGPTSGTATAQTTTGTVPSTPAASSSGQRTVVEVWTGWTEDAAKNIEAILDFYSKSQSKYQAKHVVVSDNMLQKLLAAVAAGNPPAAAVIFNGSGTVYTLAAQGGILSMDDVADPQKLGEMQKWVAKPIWDIGVYKGKLYALPMWTQSYGVYYNGKHVKDAGITEPPKTLDELNAYGEKMTVKDSSGTITRLGFDLAWIQLAIALFRGQLVSDDGSKITANHPNNVKALEWIVARYQKYGPQKVQNFYQSLQGAGERSANLDPFIAGKISTNVTGPWEIGSVQKYAPQDFEWGVWPVPGPSPDQKPGMWTYGDVFVVPKGTKSKEASWDVISWLTGATGNRDVYTKLFVVWPCVNNPDSPQMLEYPTFKQDVVDKCKGYTVFTDALFKGDYFLYPPKIPTAASYSDLLSSEAQKARLGQKSATEALNYVTQQAQKDLDDWLSKQGH